MKILLGVITAVIMLCIVFGCTRPATTNKNTTIILQTPPPIGNFNDRMKNLADQLAAYATTTTPSNTYIVTSFTNLDKLEDTNALGRLIAENLIHGLQVHKWQIIEARLTKGIDVNGAGEFTLSRDINKLKEEYKISGVITGTYSVAEGNLTINARVIDVNTGIVASSGQTYIPVNWLTDIPSSKVSTNTTMKIVSDGIK